MSRDLRSALIPVGATPSTILGLDANGATEALSAVDARTRLGVDLLRWRGAWDVATAYVAGDGVTSGGSTWRALQSVTGGSAPSEGAVWTVAASKGATGDTGPTGPSGDALAWQGAWSSGTTYATGDTVTSGGSTWRAKRSVSSGGSAPTAGDDWAVVASKGDTGATGATGPSGISTHTVNWQGSGVTATNGAGTATVTSASVVTLSLGPSATSGYYSPTFTSPRVIAAVQSSWGVDSRRFVFRVRLASITGRGSSTVVSAIIETGSVKYLLYLKGTGMGAENAGGGAAIATASPAAGSFGWDGTDYLEIRIDGAHLSCSYGRGSGSSPPSDANGWQLVSDTMLSLPGGFTGFGIGVALGQSPSGAGGSGVTATFDNVTVKGLP